eukprot:776987-Pleurochrysis_carterae.AAC.1
MKSAVTCIGASKAYKIRQHQSIPGEARRTVRQGLVVKCCALNACLHVTDGSIAIVQDARDAFAGSSWTVPVNQQGEGGGCKCGGNAAKTTGAA